MEKKESKFIFGNMENEPENNRVIINGMFDGVRIPITEADWRLIGRVMGWELTDKKFRCSLQNIEKIMTEEQAKEHSETYPEHVITVKFSRKNGEK